MPRRFRVLVGFSREDRAQISVHWDAGTTRKGTGEFERVEFGIEVADAFDAFALLMRVHREKLCISFGDYIDYSVGIGTPGNFNCVYVGKVSVVEQRFELVPDPRLIAEHGITGGDVSAPVREVEEFVFTVEMVLPGRVVGDWSWCVRWVEVPEHLAYLSA